MYGQGCEDADRDRAISAHNQRPCPVGDSRINPTGDLFKDADYQRNILLSWMLRIGRKRHLGKVTQIQDLMPV